MNEEQLRARFAMYRQDNSEVSDPDQAFRDFKAGYRAAHQQIADEGKVVVPREATDDMLDKGIEAMRPVAAVSMATRLAEAWDAMIAACEQSSLQEGKPSHSQTDEGVK